MSLSRVSNVARGPIPELTMVMESGSAAATAGGTRPIAVDRRLNSHAAVPQAEEHPAVQS
jgi:hypothetical protein